MTNFGSLTTSQLKSVIAIKEKIEALQSQIDAIVAGGDSDVPTPHSGSVTKKRRMSAAGRARIVAAQKARWAKVKGAEVEAAPKKRRKMSAAGRARMAAAAKARWATAKASGKNSL